MKQFGALVVLAITGVLFIGPTRPDAQENQAQRFRLLDSGGKTRATQGMTAQGPAGVSQVQH